MNKSMMQPPMIPIAAKLTATYSMTTQGGVRWDYDLAVEAANGASSQRGGLAVRGVDVDLGPAKPGRRVRTPWGMMIRAEDERRSGWFLDAEVGGYPVDVVLPVPESALDREGEWTAEAEPWRYTERVSALGSKSEHRVGRLSHERHLVMGHRRGDYCDTPWGRMRWVDRGADADQLSYERGFLLLGTHDRPLDDLEGDPIDPSTSREAKGSPTRVMFDVVNYSLMVVSSASFAWTRGIQFTSIAGKVSQVDLLFQPGTSRGINYASEDYVAVILPLSMFGDIEAALRTWKEKYVDFTFEPGPTEPTLTHFVFATRNTLRSADASLGEPRDLERQTREHREAPRPG